MRKLKKVKGKVQWTKVAIGFLKKNYKDFPSKELAEILGINIHSLQKKMSKLGLKKVDVKRWGKEEVDFIAQNYQTIGDVEISKAINRTVQEVRMKRVRLGYNHTPEHLKVIEQRKKDNNRYHTEKAIHARTSKETIAKRKESMKKLWEREKTRYAYGLPTFSKLLQRNTNNRPVIVYLQDKKHYCESLTEASKLLNMSVKNVWNYLNSQKLKREDIKVEYA